MARHPTHNNHSRRGWGLIEVIAALAILAGAVVLLFDAQIRGLEQVKHAQDLRLARQLAEDLVGQWQRTQYPDLGTSAETFADPPQWRWRYTSQKVLPVDADRQIEMVQVHLDIDKIGGKDIHQDGETVLSLTWLVPSVGAGNPDDNSR